MRRIHDHRGTRPGIKLVIFLLTVVAAGLGACTDRPAPTQVEPEGPRLIETLQLPGVEGTACQYGGEYPDCKPAPLPPGGEVQPTPEPELPGPEGTSTGTPGGGGTVVPPDSFPCDPGVDTTCLVPLTAQEKAYLEDAIEDRVQTSFSSPRNGAACDSLVTKLRSETALGNVYRGRTDGPDAHDGFFDPPTRSIHIDNWLWVELKSALDEYRSTSGSPDARRRLAAARSALLSVAFHEAAHKRGDRHPDSEDGSSPYQTHPFNLMDPRTSGDKCVKY